MPPPFFFAHRTAVDSDGVWFELYLKIHNETATAGRVRRVWLNGNLDQQSLGPTQFDADQYAPPQHRVVVPVSLNLGWDQVNSIASSKAGNYLQGQVSGVAELERRTAATIHHHAVFDQEFELSRESVVASLAYRAQVSGRNSPAGPR